LLGALGNALICAVAGFVVDHCGPVVALTQSELIVFLYTTDFDSLKSSLISQLVQVESLARSWPFCGSIVTLKEFFIVLACEFGREKVEY
jgi:hypothetical protein